MGVAFLYFCEHPFDFFAWDLWLQVAIGFFTGIIIAFFITLIYQALVPDTFQKVRLFYLLIVTIIPTLYTASYASEAIAITALCLFGIVAVISVAGVIIRLWKDPALGFHLPGLVLWFLFLALYYINIRTSYNYC